MLGVGHGEGGLGHKELVWFCKLVDIECSWRERG